jgi:putative YpdA family bacillithiol system oxidoreductase
VKNKLRKIVVLDRKFFWSFKDKILRKGENKTFTAQSTLTIFPIENKKLKITITFETWDDLYKGNSIKTGVKDNDSEGRTINLNYPSIVSKIIEFLITNKIWSGDNLKPINIEGLKILSELGYYIEKFKPVEDKNNMFDLIIIGAGPAGISAAYEAQKLNLNYLVLEKNLIGNTIYNYPVGLTVFSTVNELELMPNTLFPAREKPTREELLSYYTRFVLENNLKLQWEEEVKAVEKIGENHFRITTIRSEYKTKKVLFAFGAMQYPRHLNVPGEDLPKVHHLFRETYPYVKKHALVVGGGNSAGEAALFLAQEGAFATLATFRKDWEETDPKQGCIKHWVKEPLEQQLEKNCLDVFFLKRVVEIREKEIVLEEENGDIEILPNDVVFILIGSDADLTMLENLGVQTKDSKYGRVPIYDEETFETNVAGVYVVGHFTEARHIAGAIEVPKKIIPKLAEKIIRVEAI